MDPDAHVCLCFRVSRRKLVNFARRERPARASQMSACLDAGTGCGWCIPVLRRIHADPDAFDAGGWNADDYAARRQAYHADLRAGADKRTFSE